MAELAAVPRAMVPERYRVASKRQETHDTWTLELEPDGPGVAAFAPGQFGMLYAFGAGEVPISIAATEPGRLVHTVRAVGATTRAICAAKPGDMLGVRGPFGTAWPLAEAEGRDVVVAAGGVGLPPVAPVVDHLLAHRDSFGQIAVLYGGRSPEELVLLDRLEAWRSHLDVQVEVAVDGAGSDWRGRVGMVTTLVPGARFDPRNAVAMLVGPEVMMRFMATALMDRGLPSERIWISMERSMKCAVGHCGHCQLGPAFVCKDGPVFRHDEIAPLLAVREL